MNASLWALWNTVAQPAVARLKPGEWALLMILVASCLVLSVFRERYLLLWPGYTALGCKFLHAMFPQLSKLLL